MGSKRQWATYRPSPELQAASVRVTRRMQTLAMPTATRTPVKRLASPGRLNTRNVVRAESLRASGNAAAAMKVPVFTGSTLDRQPRPPAVVGIMSDVSGSMGWSTTAVGEAAWLLARGAAHSGAQVASLVFGVDVDPVVFPGEVPQQVLVRFATDKRHACGPALLALEGALRLDDVATQGIPRSRVLVILSDMMWGESEERTFIVRARRLAMLGVKIIVIGIRDDRWAHRTTGKMFPRMSSEMMRALGVDAGAAYQAVPDPPTADELRLLRRAGLTQQTPARMIFADDLPLHTSDEVRDAIVDHVLGYLGSDGMSGK